MLEFHVGPAPESVLVAFAGNRTSQRQASQHECVALGTRNSSDQAGRTDLGRVIQGDESAIGADLAQECDRCIVQAGSVVEGLVGRGRVRRAERHLCLNCA